MDLRELLVQPFEYGTVVLASEHPAADLVGDGTVYGLQRDLVVDEHVVLGRGHQNLSDRDGVVVHHERAAADDGVRLSLCIGPKELS